MKRYWPNIKRYSWIMGACAVLAALIGLFMAFVLPPPFVATASVLVQAQSPGNSITALSATDPSGSVDKASTYAAEIPTREVMTYIAHLYPQLAQRGYSIEDLMKNVTAAPSASTAIITIQASDHNMGNADLLTNDVALGFAAFVQQQSQHEVDTLRTTLQGQLAAYQKQKAALEAAIVQLPTTATNTTTTTTTSSTPFGPATTNGTTTSTTGTGVSSPIYTIDLNNLNTVNQYINQIQSQLLQLPPTVRGDVSVIQVATPADTRSTSKTLILAASIGLGLVLGVIIMLLLIYLDDRLLSEDAVHEKLGMTYLGGLASNDEVGKAPADVLGEPLREASNIYATARMTGVLGGSRNGTQGKVLLVTSAQTAEGKTTVAATLAAAVARAGGNVVLVDADLRHPGTHNALGMPPADLGLGELLAAKGRLDDVLRVGNIPGFWWLPAGEVMQTPTLLLEQRLPEILGVLREKFDAVIIDGPGVLDDADAALMASMVDGVALVADVRHSTLPVLLRAKDLLSSLSHAPAGIVMNRLPRRPRVRNYATAQPRIAVTGQPVPVPLGAVAEYAIATSRAASNGKQD